MITQQLVQQEPGLMHSLEFAQVNLDTKNKMMMRIDVWIFIIGLPSTFNEL